MIDASNAVPLYLAATTHGAKQLAALCEYWMGTDLAISASNEQWPELSAEVKARVSAQNARLEAARAAHRAERELMAQLPCLLAPSDPTVTRARTLKLRKKTDFFGGVRVTLKRFSITKEAKACTRTAHLHIERGAETAEVELSVRGHQTPGHGCSSSGWEETFDMIEWHELRFELTKPFEHDERITLKVY